MSSVLHTIRRMARDDVRPLPNGASGPRSKSRRHGWIGPPRSPSRSPLGSPAEPPDGDGAYVFFGTPRIASSCLCDGCWATPPAPCAPATVSASVRDRKPLPFLPTKRKPAPKLDKSELEAMREAYPSPPPEEPPNPVDRVVCPADPQYQAGPAETDTETDDDHPLPDTPPPVPAKDDVQAVRAQYEPVSAAELKSLYDEIWLSMPATGGPTVSSTAQQPNSSPVKPSSTVSSVSATCATCPACIARARSRSSVASASHASLGRSTRRPRRPTLSMPAAPPTSASTLSPPATEAAPPSSAAPAAPTSPAQVAPLAPRLSQKRRRAPESLAMRRATMGQYGRDGQKRLHPGGPRPRI